MVEGQKDPRKATRRSITDKDWFDSLSALQPDEVNFWQPGAPCTPLTRTTRFPGFAPLATVTDTYRCCPVAICTPWKYRKCFCPDSRSLTLSAVTTFFARITSPVYAVPDAALAEDVAVSAFAAPALTARVAEAPAVAMDAIMKS